MNKDTEDSSLIVQHISALNARRTSRAEAAANFLAVFIVGVLGAILLVHFLTPCAEGLC